MKYIVECVISAHEAPMAIVSSYILSSSSTIMRLHRPVFLYAHVHSSESPFYESNSQIVI